MFCPEHIFFHKSYGFWNKQIECGSMLCHLNTRIIGLILISFVLQGLTQICRTASKFTRLCALELILYVRGTENLQPTAK